MKKFTMTGAALSLILLIVTLSSCDDDKNGPGAPKLNADVQLINNSKLGTIMADKEGRTLYIFSPDVSSPTLCVGDCIVVWPVFYQPNPTLGNGLDPKDFGVVDRPDGKKQTTYKGWPLYYFQNDKAPGDTNGDGLEKLWFVSRNNYTVMIGNTQLIGKDGVSYTSVYTPGLERLAPLITDDRGRTLYTFTKDFNNKNNYTTETDTVKNNVWPIFAGTKDIVVPSTLKSSDFQFITVFNKQQLVFRGNPTYTYGGDAGTRGSTKGVSVPTPGVWPVASDSLTKVAPMAPAAAN